MTTLDRRTILASGALALAGTAVQGGPAAAQAGPKAMFPVPATTIPIVGETDVFQVRRIYCIGRNYAAPGVGGGWDPGPRAAVFLPEADRCDPERRGRR